MASYPQLARPVPGDFFKSRQAIERCILPYLLDVWWADYTARTARHHIVKIDLDGYGYLFDTHHDARPGKERHERLVAAWTVSGGAVAHKRDSSRMRGHPLTGRPGYHRGHVIPHQLGGLYDINLVDQRGALNVGEFRRLERQAVATPGALYFTYWQYAGASDTIPSHVDQGLLVPGQAADIVTHRN